MLKLAWVLSCQSLSYIMPLDRLKTSYHFKVNYIHVHVKLTSHLYRTTLSLHYCTWLLSLHNQWIYFVRKNSLPKSIMIRSVNPTRSAAYITTNKIMCVQSILRDFLRLFSCAPATITAYTASSVMTHNALLCTHEPTYKINHKSDPTR